MESRLKFDRQFFREFWALCKPYWTSNEKWIAFGFIALNLACILLEIRSQVGLNNFSKDFYNTLQTCDKSALFTQVKYFAVIATVMIFSQSSSLYFQNLLSVRWRRWLTNNYLQKWLDNNNYYYMQFLTSKIDNPDQRLSEDLMEFPDQTLEIFFIFLNTSITFITFSIILWNLSGSFAIPINNFHLAVPGYLCWTAILYSLCGAWVTNIIGKKLAGFEYQQQKFNANFRFSLARMREYGEQIAFYKGEKNENNKLQKLFSNVYTNFIKVLAIRTRLTFFTRGYSTVTAIIGIIFVLPIYFQKKISYGEILQINNAFTSAVMAFAFLISAYELLATWQSVVNRLTEFNKTIDAMIEKKDSDLIIKSHTSSELLIDHLTVALPNGEALLNLNLIFQPKNSYLIVGRSGIGKSTLLRTMAGIWPNCSGTITVPQNANMFFLPQKPYLPLGSLQEILMYPNSNEVDKSNLTAALYLYRLDKYIEQLDVVQDWSKILSLGEQQLIAFVRAHLHKPDILFLDEATSALDEAMEFQAYKNIREHLSEAIIVSVGHRSSLRGFHEHVLDVGDKQRTTTSIADSNTVIA